MFLFFYGAVAQLVERMDGIHEATGSIPVSSTSLVSSKLGLAGAKNAKTVQSSDKA